MNETIEKLKEEARDSWPGGEGDRRAAELESFVRTMLAEYSAALGVSQDDLLKAIESRRRYFCCNFYQRSNWPSLENVRIFANLKELQASLGPPVKFRCPACNEASTSPYECNSGAKLSDGKTCDWKSWGLFGTMGKGLRIAIRAGFLDHPKVEEIFMPINPASPTQSQTHNFSPVGGAQ